MDLDELDRLWERHPAWRLLRARNAPLVLSFLGRQFVDDNRGAVAASILIEALDDALYAIHQADPERFPARPVDYLDEWSSADCGWLRKFYPIDSDEVHYEATPALEKAYRWAETLKSRAFVGTESRLQTLVDLLRQIVHGAEADPEVRVAELERRLAAIQEELDEARVGRFAVLGATAARERYQQFAAMARELLSDFREVEENFRALDRSAREMIAGWEGGKGDLLAELVGNRSDIASSDQGQSFRAFHDYLLSEERQDEVGALLESVHRMTDIGADNRVRRVQHEWADAAERTQQTVRSLSEQLRRFLDDQVWVENRRVMEIVRGIEASAIAVREAPPGVGMDVDEPGVAVTLPFERPLYDLPPDAVVNSMLDPEEVGASNLSSLLAQRFVDPARLAENVRAVLPQQATVGLAEIVRLYPVDDGIAEILGYMSLAAEDLTVQIGAEEMMIDYLDASGVRRTVRMPEVWVTRR